VSDDKERKLEVATQRIALVKRFGEELHRLRDAKGLTRAELARKCRIHESLLSAIEIGRREPGIMMLLTLADGLEVAPAEMLLSIQAPTQCVAIESGR
jgi:transcriptional regulator with XRE-family HTH domain